MTLTSAYETQEGKTYTYLVRVAGVPLQVFNLDIALSQGVAASASFEIPNPLPLYIVIEAAVEIYGGYGGDMAILFTGAVVSGSPTATGVVVECAGEGRKLTRTFKRTIATITSQDVNTIIEGWLTDAGVTNFVVNLPLWTVGAVVPFVVEFTNYSDAINQLALVDGDPWYETATGQIRVEVKDAWPAPSPFRRYFSGDTEQLDAAQRALLAVDQLPALDMQPAVLQGVVDAAARPRIRYGIKQTTLVQNVKNYVVIEGAVIDVPDGNGGTTGVRLEGRSQAASPWITTPPGFKDVTYDMGAIDTQAKADTTAARYEYKNNRLDQHTTIQVDFDPEIQPGMTVQVEDPQFTRITGNWFVYGYRHRMQPTDASTELDLRGGVLSGTTPLLFPIADFIFANAHGTAAKIAQVLPAGKGNIVTFDGRSSFDPDGFIVSWDWADDQGNTGTGSVIQFSYDAALDSIVMTLTVTDNDGLTDSISKTVNLKFQNDCGSSDVLTATLAAAIKAYMTASSDGGQTWHDLSKAAAGVAGDFVRVAINNSAREVKDQFTFGDPPTTPVIAAGTDQGELVITRDTCQTVASLINVSSHAITALANGPSSVAFNWGGVEDWYVGDAVGNLYKVSFAYVPTPVLQLPNVVRNLGSDPIQHIAEVGAYIQISAGNFAFGVIIACGSTADPATMLAIIADGGTSTHILGYITINGALLDAINAAGAGHHIVAISLFVLDRLHVAAAIMFDTGVSPRVWYTPTLNFNEINWQPATGMSGADGQDLAVGIAPSGLGDFVDLMGFALGDVLAVLATETKTYKASDGIAFTQGTNAAPSQIERVVWEAPLLNVYLAAAHDGIAKSVDGGDTWGYIRPHGTLSIPWPAGAEGKDVAFYSGTVAPDTCARIYSLGYDSGGANQTLRMISGLWQQVS